MKTEYIFPEFPKRICAGDSRTIQHGRYTVTARVVPDHDSNPNDFDCYTPEQFEAFMRDEWDFYGVILSVSVDGYTLDTHAASLWAIECGLGENDGAYIRETANDLLPDAIARAEAIRAELLQKLSA